MNNENKFVLFMFMPALDNYSAQQFAAGVGRGDVQTSSFYSEFLPFFPPLPLLLFLQQEMHARSYSGMEALA